MSTTYPELPNTTFPEEVQSFVTMLNMAVEDAEAVTNYQNAMRNGDFDLAQQYFSQITNGNQKFISASTMNKLMETCVALQKFYQTDIEPYVETRQSEWEATISKFHYRGTYSASSTYVKNNFVLYRAIDIDLLFICIADAPAGTLPTDTNYWRQLTIQGVQGISGDGATFRYAWNSSQYYTAQDIVSDNNAIWLCTQANTNRRPSSNPTYWSSIYTANQIAYPFQKTQPPTTGMSVGYIWFKDLS